MKRMNIRACLFLVSILTACAGNDAPGIISPSGGAEAPGISPGKAERPAGFSPAAGTLLPDDIGAELERIAEIERAGAYFPGLALAESGIREKAGDYSGAAIAAFKELSWAYGYGGASKNQVEEGLRNALTLFVENSQVFGSPGDLAATAFKGCIAFIREDWARAEELLSGVLKPGEEPDSFLRWMLCVCTLEQEAKVPKNEIQACRLAYGAIRARYQLFPEYWYRGARAFSAQNINGDENIAAAYAEQCVNISPQGPYAEDCRGILANYLGLTPNGKDSQSGDKGSSSVVKDVLSGVRTKAEIEQTIRASVSVNNPFLLQELFPLMALPDNPYTFYAMGAMKALTAVPEYRNFFLEEALKHQGRLGERLNYISRG